MINISVLQDMNPWWQGKVTEAQKFRRMEFDNIFKSLEKMEVTAIIGARRIGKTTLIKQAIVEILKKTESKNILFINADDVRLEITSYKELEEIIEYYFSNILSKEKSELDKKVYVFIDEAQYVKGWSGVSSSETADEKAFSWGTMAALYLASYGNTGRNPASILERIDNPENYEILLPGYYPMIPAGQLPVLVNLLQ